MDSTDIIGYIRKMNLFCYEINLWYYTHQFWVMSMVEEVYW